MSVDPDSLMIFKGREDDQDTKKALKGPKELTIFALTTKTEKEELELGPGGKNVETVTQQNTPTSVYSNSQPAAAQPVAPAEAPVQKKAPARIPMSKNVAAEEFVPQTDNKPKVRMVSGKEYTVKSATTGKQTEEDLSRQAAKKHMCVWHPWREAYAVCEYCHRPFCFEDTVEFNKAFYCLEDIDSVSVDYNDKINRSGNRIRMLSGIILAAIAVYFFYISGAQIITIIAYVEKSGIPYFMAHANFSYLFAFISTLFMLLALGNGIALIGESRTAIYMAFVTCLANIALFAYLFVSSGTIYLGAIAIAVFVAMVVLIYSRTAYVNKEEVESERQEVQNNVLRWPNVGQF